MNAEPSARGAVAALRIAGWMNIIGVPASTRCFTDDAYFRMAPKTYSRLTLFVAWLAGVAFVASAKSAATSPRLLALFTLEKGYFAVAGFHWLATRSRTHRDELEALSPSTFRMFHLNGAFDGFWAITFAVLLSRARRGNAASD